MSLFTFNSRRFRGLSGPLVGFCIFIGINLFVATLPPGAVRKQFENDIKRISEASVQADVFVFGDSRSAVLDQNLFLKNTLNLSAVSNTIAYSWLILKKAYDNTDVRPKVVFLMLGANNYNRNGIFAKRDYALSQVAGLRDIFSLFLMSGGVEYGIDGLFGRIVPIYGRRMEIRSPRAIVAKIEKMRGKILEPRTEAEELQTGDKPTRLLDDSQHLSGHEAQVQDEFPAVVRRAVFDENYYLTYKRSVYQQYEISRLHLQMLEEVIELARAHGASIFLIQLPIEKKMYDLQQRMVGNKFDRHLDRLAKKSKVFRLDFRKLTEFEFVDINHLSPKGSARLIQFIINPIILNI